jgi:serine/threonine protein phosphatase PrpC
MPIRIDTCVAQHIGDRVEQQDRITLVPHGRHRGTVMAVLADGMGGHTGGTMAAEQIVHTAQQLFSDFAPNPGGGAQPFLRSVISEAHVAIKLSRFTSDQDPHSTAVVLVLQPDRVDWAHCGDSRAYHFRGEALVARTPDHSLVAEMVRQGRISEFQALNHPHRSVLMHCLGADTDPRVDFGATAPLAADDTFLLCSDGLWTYFSDEELGGVLAAYNPRESAEILIQRARDRAAGQGDNLSLAIIKLSRTLAQQPAAAAPGTVPEARAAVGESA